jgi:hypothetical protein
MVERGVITRGTVPDGFLKTGLRNGLSESGREHAACVTQYAGGDPLPTKGLLPMGGR